MISDVIVVRDLSTDDLESRSKSIAQRPSWIDQSESRSRLKCRRAEGI